MNSAVTPHPEFRTPHLILFQRRHVRNDAAGRRGEVDPASMDTDSPAPLSPYAGLAAKIRPDGSRDTLAYSAERALRQPILRIALRPGFILLRPFTEPCRVLVDGQSLGGLTSNTKFEAAVAAGHHTVRVVRGWLSSNVMEVQLVNGDVAQFLCSGHNSSLDLAFGLAILFAALLPRRFYWLKPFHR